MSDRRDLDDDLERLLREAPPCLDLDHDRLLREEPPYLDDHQFTERVMARLPVRAKPLGRRVGIALGGAALGALPLAVGPTHRFLVDAASSAFMSPLASLPTISAGLITLVMLAWSSIAYVHDGG
jgi:hypothetical protein